MWDDYLGGFHKVSVRTHSGGSQHGMTIWEGFTRCRYTVEALNAG